MHEIIIKRLTYATLPLIQKAIQRTITAQKT